MALHNQGPLSAFSGKLGPIVGSTWKNKNVMRARSRKARAKVTTNPKLLAQRERFRVASSFVRELSELFKVTYPEFESGMTGRNNALGTIIRESIIGTYPNFSLKFDNIRVSKGSVVRPDSPVASSTEPGILKFTWRDNTGIGTTSKATDKAVLVAYCPELEAGMYLVNGPERSDESGTIPMAALSGKLVHTWMAFLSQEKKRSSESLYTGAVTIA